MSEEKKISWNEALEGNYIVLEQDKRHRIVATNPRIVEVEKQFKGDDEPKLMPELRLDVLNFDGEKYDTPKEFTATSKRLMKALNKVGLDDDVKPGTAFSFSVKKIGEKQDTNYDVEDFKFL